MFDDVYLTDCPEDYAFNCKNYEIKCHECKANSTGKYLQYRPINKAFNKHPCSLKKKSGATSYSRQGRRVEKSMTLKNPYLIPNYVSGALVGDGDCHMDLTNLPRIRVEIKCRFTAKGNIYPAAKEYREAKTQDISIIMVNQTQYLNTIYAYMNLKLFLTMWRTIICCEDVKWNSEDYLYGDIYMFYKHTKDQYNLEKVSFFLGEECNSPTNIFKDNMMRYSRMVIYQNDFGQYVMMHSDTLSEFINLYNYVTLK